MGVIRCRPLVASLRHAPVVFASFRRMAGDLPAALCVITPHPAPGLVLRGFVGVDSVSVRDHPDTY